MEMEVIIAFEDGPSWATTTRRVADLTMLDAVVEGTSPYYQHMSEVLKRGGAVLHQDKREYGKYARLGLTGLLCHINSEKRLVLLGYGLPPEDHTKLFRLRDELIAFTGIPTTICLEAPSSK